MLKKLFGFDPSKTTVRTEIIAGITTFLTMSYILAINPAIFSEISMPAGAIAPVLILVGLMMLEPVTRIPFDDFTEAIPAFICIIMMPLTYSISNGILIGMIAYVLINLVCGNFKKLTPTMYILAILFILKYIFI